ncbi:MAG: thioredoxin reductase, partial [Thermoleophilaceae bacterium]|nr:thioredoxin reductase [Thermoleophilaceae bacterium]
MPPRPTVHVVGRSLSPEGHRLRDFLTRIAQPFEFHDEGSEEARRLLEQVGAADAELPVVIDAGVVRPGDVHALADAWGITARPSKLHYDIAIIGAGPAGLAAAVYAA